MSPAATASSATLDLRRARRLALAKAGLLRSDASALPRRAAGSGRRARQAALEVIDRFGYLQLDTVSVAGARSHSLVLLSRLEGMDPALGESLLRPGEPLFEYWGHEASWLPIDLYPVFAFRRLAFRRHPWWGDLLAEHRRDATAIVERIRAEGPLRSVDLEGKSGAGWWNLKLTKRLANALWSSGELAIRERRSFQRSYDLPERVIPAEVLGREVPRADAFEILLLRALEGFGWATTGTLAQTWRLRNARADIDGALRRLVERGAIVACKLVGRGRARSRVGSSPRTSSSPSDSPRPARAATAACCSRPSIRCCGIASACACCSASITSARSSCRRPSGDGATSACRCSRATDWWRAPTSRRTAAPGASTCCRSTTRQPWMRWPRQAVRSALERHAAALGLELNLEHGPAPNQPRKQVRCRDQPCPRDRSRNTTPKPSRSSSNTPVPTPLRVGIAGATGPEISGVIDGVGVMLGVGVMVRVTVTVAVLVTVGVLVPVRVRVTVGVAEGGAGVDVLLGVLVTVAVFDTVGVFDGVSVFVTVGVLVTVLVIVGVLDGAGVFDGVGDRVGLGVAVIPVPRTT